MKFVKFTNKDIASGKIGPEFWIRSDKVQRIGDTNMPGSTNRITEIIVESFGRITIAESVPDAAAAVNAALP
jgi:hypothetical protein